MHYGTEVNEQKHKAEMWDYYQYLLKQKGFEGITDLLKKYRYLERQLNSLRGEKE